jgi:hypothetical protein
VYAGPYGQQILDCRQHIVDRQLSGQKHVVGEKTLSDTDIVEAREHLSIHLQLVVMLLLLLL